MAYALGSVDRDARAEIRRESGMGLPVAVAAPCSWVCPRGMTRMGRAGSRSCRVENVRKLPMSGCPQMPEGRAATPTSAPVGSLHAEAREG